MKRAICSLLAGAAVCAVAWIAGFDFNERGQSALATAVFAALAMAFCYTCPAWTPHRSHGLGGGR